MLMKRFALVLAASAVSAALAWAAPAATYQKTGTVKEVTTDGFTLDLGKEVWRFYSDGATQGKEAVKAGDKVTVTYKQVATKVEGKPAAKPEGKPAAKKAK